MLVMPGQWTVWVLHLFTCLRMTNTPISLQEIHGKNAPVNFLGDCPITRREPATNMRAIIHNFRMVQRTFGRRARQRHTKTTTNHETRRNAAGGTQRCGSRHFSGGGTTPLPPTAFFPFTRPRARPLSVSHVQYHPLFEHELCTRASPAR